MSHISVRIPVFKSIELETTQKLLLINEGIVAPLKKRTHLHLNIIMLVLFR